ncbi:MAG TPA: PKD domain-containing protein [Methanofastidiosum sp.]|nr:PKD domain-containing protein [Methanofastidiosum sp.]HPA48507.1 PKD domain-containing protein [Methanofastidiosum sp.]HQK62800.1 PKD domain-containing protein [Methanofastidiosum sp.]HQM94524.1 PKD domain-containing protein [Methanofastidiosum sp.]HQQ48873.1 PKD domain-containing protein [Methanofastidiosum sp.]
MFNKTKLFSAIFIGILLLGISLPAVFGFALIETVTISPTFEATISERNPTTNYCSYSDIWIGKSTSDGKEARGIIRFDLSSIPSGATITKADLTLYFHKMEAGSGVSTVGAYWIINGLPNCPTVTWLKRSSTSNWSNAGGDYSSAVGPMDTTSVSWDSHDGDKHILDVKYYVEKYASGYFTSNYGFMLKATSSNDKAQFYSTSSAPAGKKPVLVVTYQITGPSPIAKPDLTITDISKDSSDRVILKIANQGSANFSGNLGVQIWFNGISKYNVTGSATIPSGSVATFTATTLTLPEGSTVVKAKVDPTNVIEEENETNNEATETISIGSTPPTNNPPQANAGANKTSKVGQSISFNGSGSSDSDGSIISYAWDFGDGDSSIGSVVSHTYSAAGAYTASLTVTDNDGATDTDTVLVTISESSTPPPSTNKTPKAVAGSDIKVKVGEQVHFDASGSSDPDGTITSYAWDFGDSRDSNEKEPLHSYATPGVYKVTLVVTDNNGGTDNDVIYVTVEQESSLPIKGVPGFEVPGVLGAAALVYYYLRRRKN